MPYQKLKNTVPADKTCGSCFTWNKPKKDVKPPTPIEMIRNIDEKILILKAKSGVTHYECKILTTTARDYLKNDNKVMCKVDLQLRHQRRRTLQVYGDCIINLDLIKCKIEESASLETIAADMHLANDYLKLAISKVDQDETDTLIYELARNTKKINKLGDALAEKFNDFDIDEEIAELEDETGFYLPDLNKKTKIYNSADKQEPSKKKHGKQAATTW